MSAPAPIIPHEDPRSVAKNLLNRCSNIGIGLGGLGAVMVACDLDQLERTNAEALRHLGYLIEIASSELLDVADQIDKRVDRLPGR